MTNFKLETAKKVNTIGIDNKLNGFLIELGKKENLTTSYLSCCSPGAFKGYHLHLIRKARYVCVKGKLHIYMYFHTGKQEVILDSNEPKRLYIPELVPTALYNPYDEEAWIINVPEPAYDPEIKEQIELTEDECKEKIKLGLPFYEVK